MPEIKKIDEISAELAAKSGETQGEPSVEQTQVEQTQNEQPEQSVQQVPSPTKDQFELLMRASEAASQKLGTLAQENAALKAQLEQYRAMVEQQSQKAEQAINENLTVPTLDLNELQYMSDEDRQAAQEKYALEMAEYNRAKLMSELAPFINAVKEQQKTAEEQAIIGKLANNPEFDGFSDSLEQIRGIIDKTPALKQADPQTRYVAGYLMYQGLQNKTKKESTEDLVNKVMNDPNALRMIEERRAMSTAAKNSAVPAVSASMGTSPATPQSKPKNLDEARAALFKAFKIGR